MTWAQAIGLIVTIVVFVLVWAALPPLGSTLGQVRPASKFRPSKQLKETTKMTLLGTACLILLVWPLIPAPVVVGAIAVGILWFEQPSRGRHVSPWWAVWLIMAPGWIVRWIVTGKPFP